MTASIRVVATSGTQTVTDSVAVTVTPVVPLAVSLEPARLECLLGESAVVRVRVAGSRSGRPALHCHISNVCSVESVGSPYAE